MSLELEAWREVCGRPDSDELLTRLGSKLAGHGPISELLLRRLDLERGCLETVGVSATGQEHPLRRARTPLAARDLELLTARCAEGRVVRLAGRDDDLRRLVAPEVLRSELLVGPLVGPEGLSGVLIWAAPAGRRLGAREEALLQELLAPVAAQLERSRLQHEVSRLREAARADQRGLTQPQDISASIVGAETGLRAVMERVELVAPTEAPVLILGETGSGKEVVARAIHSRSRRASGPMLRVNCGAIPAELIDSELFGHERGSFTGAVVGRQGWFERADGGTLFLDEIGELPLAAQVRLLRILQDGSFERVGGQKTISVDVRLVTATHRDLQAMIQSRQFREDLWYRIHVFPIRLPPLRERTEDIPALASYFARRASLRLGGLPLSPTLDDLEQLLAYDWPGNVRELAAVIERAAILGKGKRLEIATALGVGAPHEAEPAAAVEGVGDALVNAELPSLDEAMRRHIEAALERTHGRIEGPTGAAELLRINPHTLRARMRKLGVRWQRYRRPARHR